MLYLMHFNRPLKHARHYLGFVDGGPVALEERVATHKAGRGARILAAANERGIGYRVARVWRGSKATRKQERRLKNLGGLAPLCPVCSGATAHRRGRL